MNCRDKLAQIKQDLLSANFEISTHAYMRMIQRKILAVDILAFIQNGLEHASWNQAHGSWNFTGVGFDPRSFTIA